MKSLGSKHRRFPAWKREGCPCSGWGRWRSCRKCLPLPVPQGIAHRRGWNILALRPYPRGGLKITWKAHWEQTHRVKECVHSKYFFPFTLLYFAFLLFLTRIIGSKCPTKRSFKSADGDTVAPGKAPCIAGRGARVEGVPTTIYAIQTTKE